ACHRELGAALDLESNLTPRLGPSVLVRQLRDLDLDVAGALVGPLLRGPPGQTGERKGAIGAYDALVREPPDVEQARVTGRQADTREHRKGRRQRERTRGEQQVARRGCDRAAGGGELYGARLRRWHRGRDTERTAFLILEPAERGAHQGERVVGEEDVVVGVVQVLLGDRAHGGEHVLSRAQHHGADALPVARRARDVRRR